MFAARIRAAKLLFRPPVLGQGVSFVFENRGEYPHFLWKQPRPGWYNNKTEVRNLPEGEFMEFIITPELAEHMKKRKKTGIAVKVATSDHSDFDVTELFLQLVNDDFADYLKEKYNYRERTAESGERVLLPNYRLEYDRRVVFGLKKVFLFHKMTMEGVRL